MNAIILAGGEGKRMHPLTADIPKPMVKLKGIPILEHIILRLKRWEICNIYISVGYKNNKIIDYFKDGKFLGVNIKYFIEDKPLGTAGCIAGIDYNYNIYKDGNFFLMNGDVVTSIDFFDFAYNSLYYKDDITMAIKCLKEKKEFGIVNINPDTRNVCSVIERPTDIFCVNAGLYCISPNVIDKVPLNQFYTMPELINFTILEGGNVGMYNIGDDVLWKGIENINDLMEIENENIGYCSSQE